MSDTTNDLALARLREREAQLLADVKDFERSAMVARACANEVSSMIELLERGGKRKPGRKPAGDAPFLSEPVEATEAVQ